MSSTVDMTVGNPTKHILKFALPLLLANFGQQLYMLVDAAIVGRGVSVKALAAVGATDWTCWLILWSAIGFTQGFSTLISRYFGNKDYTGINKIIAMSTLLCIALGGILTVAGLSLASPILHALNTPDDIIGGAKTYLLTMVSGTIVVTAYNMASAILRALGNGKTPLLAMVIAGILNIGLDFLFVFAFDWGIFGAAIASVISQFVSFLYCLFAILKIDFIKLDRTAWRFDWKVIKALLSLGTPIALEYVIISLGGIFLQSSVNLQGSSFIAGYTATNKVYGLLECSATSLGLACSTFLAQNYGATLYDRVKYGVKTSVYIAVLIAVIVLSLTLLFRKYLLLLFLDVNQAGGYDALTIAVRYLTIMTVFLIVLYLIHVFRNSLQAIGIASWSFLSGISEFLCRVFMAKIAVHWAWLDSDALFVSEPVAWFGALLTVFLPYFYYRKKLLETDGKNKNADNPVDVPSSEL